MRQSSPFQRLGAAKRASAGWQATQCRQRLVRTLPCTGCARFPFSKTRKRAILAKYSPGILGLSVNSIIETSSLIKELSFRFAFQRSCLERTDTMNQQQHHVGLDVSVETTPVYVIDDIGAHGVARQDRVDPETITDAVRDIRAGAIGSALRPHTPTLISAKRQYPFCGEQTVLLSFSLSLSAPAWSS
jgi:hypothetical protein